MSSTVSNICPTYAPFLGFAGAAAALVFTTIGSAYGCAKSGIAIAGLGQFEPQLVMKSLIPVVMSGIIGVYGLVVGILITGDMSSTDPYSAFNGFLHLGAGLAVGFTGLAAGWVIGIVGDSGMRSFMQEKRIYVSIVLILIFAEVLAL